MNIDETLKVMRALASGKDPESEQLLDETNICRRPLIVKALNRAISSLVQEQKREQNKPAKAFHAWTGAEIAQVCEELRQGMDFHDIAKKHNRTVASIIARLIKLGKIAPPKAA
jgi:hypothetical protein